MASRRNMFDLWQNRSFSRSSHASKKTGSLFFPRETLNYFAVIPVGLTATERAGGRYGRGNLL